MLKHSFTGPTMQIERCSSMARLVEAMHPKELDYSDYSRHRDSKKRNNILLCGIEASRSIEVPSIAPQSIDDSSSLISRGASFFSNTAGTDISLNKKKNNSGNIYHILL